MRIAFARVNALPLISLQIQFSRSLYRNVSASSRLLGLVAQWRALGVGAVLSQKLLHPTLRAHLLATGIVPLERLSIRHAQAAHALCGGAMIGVAAAPESVAALGELGSIRLVCFFDRLHLNEMSLTGLPFVVYCLFEVSLSYAASTLWAIGASYCCAALVLRVLRIHRFKLCQL